MLRRSLKFLAASLVLCAVTATASAQHHHHNHHHHPTYYGSNWGHPNWNYVVPTYSHYGHDHHGTYYTQGTGYYYTPTSVVQPVVYTGSTTSYVQQTVMKPVQLEYGSFAQCADLSGRLETDANNLCLDLHYNYQANPGFAELYREAYQVLQDAKQIHASEHLGNREDVRRRVSSLDSQFHHIQGEMATFTRQNYRQVAHGGVQEKASAMEAILHHLAYTVGVEPHTAHAGGAPLSGGITGEVAPPPVR